MILFGFLGWSLRGRGNLRQDRRGDQAQEYVRPVDHQGILRPTQGVRKVKPLELLFLMYI